MVAIFTGSGTGFERGSGSLLGGAGLVGGPGLGRSGEQVLLNAFTGNLLISQRDEFLVGRGPDASISRTYNSLGDLSDDNGDNWRQSSDRRIYALTGTLNTAGSTVRRVSADGSDILYKWNGSEYATYEGAGAVDKLVSNGTVWTWTDGDSQVTERYEAQGTNNWAITRQTDSDGNEVSFAYSNGKLSTVTTSDGSTLQYSWSGNNIAAITTGYTDLATSSSKTSVRTRYGYDGSNRLTSVTVDLSPDDSSIADGNTYVTSYGYDGTSRRIAWIGETDGSRIDFTYDGSGRVQTIAQAVATGVTRTTTIAYSAAATTITDAAGQATKLEYDSDGALRRITAPPAETGGAPRITEFAYVGQPAVSDASFERVEMGSTWAWTPSTPGTVYSGRSFAAGNGSAWGFAVAPEGDQVGIIQTWGGDTGSISKNVTGLVSGATYRLTFQLAQRPNWAGNPITVSVDGASLGTYTPQSTAFQSFATIAFKATATTATIAFAGSLAPVDTATAIDNIAVGLAPPDGSYELPEVNSGYSYNAQIAGTTFAGGSGIAGNGSAWGFAAAPDGDQVAFIQTSGAITHTTLGLTPGTSYRINFKMAQRPGYAADPVTVSANGASLGTFTPQSTAFASFSSAQFEATGTSNTITFTGTASATDIASALDAVWFEEVAPVRRLASVTDPAGYVTSFVYDAAGNLISTTDRNGDVTTRTYGSKNQLRTETVTGSDPLSADAAHTTRYAYDAENHLRYVVGAEGDVVEYQYNAAGQIEYAIEYPQNYFDVSGYAPTATITETQLVTWRAGVGTANRIVSRNYYDLRGNLTRVTRYGEGTEVQETFFAYDQSGQLLSRYNSGQATERFVYDGLGRLIGSSDLNGGTTRIAFHDANGETVVSLASGLVRTSTYNKAGELIAETESTGANLLRNGQILAGTDGWTLTNAQRVAAPAGAPTPYLFQTAAGASFGRAETQTAPVPDGSSFLLSYSAKPGSAGQQFENTILWFNASGTYLGGQTWNDFPSDTTQFTTYEHLFAPVATAASYMISSTAVGSATAQWGGFRITADNLVANPTLAAGTQGYTLGNAERAAGPGGAMPYVFRQSSSAGNGISNSVSQPAPEGATFYFSYSIKPGAAGQQFQSALLWYDANGIMVGGNTWDHFPTDTTQFTTIEREVARPPSAVSYYFYTAAAGGAVGEWGGYRLSPRPTTAGTASQFAPASQVFLYDAAGRVRVATDATGSRSYFVYDKAGRKTADVNALGWLTEYRYDADDRTVATIHYSTALGSATLLTLADPSASVDIGGIRPAAQDTDVCAWQVYDAGGRVVSTVDGTGSVATFAYDKSDRLIKTVRYANTLTATQVNAFRTTPPTATVLPTADTARDSVARNFYDRQGRLVAALDGEGYLSRTVYDRAGQVIEQIAYANPTQAGSRASGTLSQLLDTLESAGDRHTRFAYDPLGQLRFEIDGLNQPTEHVYDSNGAVVCTIRYAGNITATTDYSYANVKSLVTASGLGNATATRRSWSVYDGAGRLAYSIDAENGVTRFVYDRFGRVVRTVQYAAARTTTSLPAIADMDAWAAAQEGQAQNRVTRSFYDARGELRFVVDAEGYVTRRDVDAEGRLKKEVRFDTAVSLTDWATIETVSALAVGTSSDTRYLYDAGGALTDTIGGENQTVHYAYNANGLLASKQIVETSPSVTMYEYDAAGRVKAERAAYGTADAASTLYSYDGLGNVVSVTDPRNSVTTRTYDRLGRMLTQTDALSQTVQYQYNAFGDAVKVTDALQQSRFNYYDRLGRLTVSRDAESYVTETAYDAFGDVASVLRRYNKATNTATTTDLPVVAADTARDATTGFAYDRLGRVTATTDAENKTESYVLDAFGNRLQVQNKVQGVTTNAFDRRGLLVAETLPMNSVAADGTVVATSVTNKFEYDARGNNTKKIEAWGLPEQRSTIYVYDKADRLTETRGDAVPVINANYVGTVATVPIERSYYDAQTGRVTETVSASGARTLFYYDRMGRVSVELGALGAYTTYSYDANGNVLSTRTYEAGITLPQTRGGTPPSPPSGGYRETAQTYDALNRLKTTSIAGLRTGAWTSGAFATTVGTVTTSVDYDAAGNVVKETDGNGAVAWSWYDKAGRKTAGLDREGYLTASTYDSEGNVLTERRYATKFTGTPTLAAPPTVATDADNDRVTEFVYDRNGRRTLEKRLGVAAYTVNATTGALTLAATTASIAWEYNGLGEVTRKTEANGDATAYAYDGAGRLVTETRAAFLDSNGASVTPTLRYAYNGLNDLSRTVQGGAAAATGDRVTTNTYGAGGRLIQSTDAANASHFYYYDIAGGLIADAYTRTRSNNTTVDEAVLYTRDVLGRVTSQAVGTLSGSTWTKGDTARTQYNVFGEVAKRGVDSGSAQTPLMQEQFDYDGAGRLLRSNSGDGVWRYFVFDNNGNQTLSIESEGSDLSGGTLTAAQARDAVLTTASAGGTVGSAFVDGLNASITVFDKRGLAVQTILPQRELGAGQARTALTTSRVYNAFGEAASETDARGYTTDFTYNAMGRLIEKKSPLVGVTGENGVTSQARPTEKLYYDLAGRLVASDDANGNRTSRLLLAGTGHQGSEALVSKEFHADQGVVLTGYNRFGDAVRVEDEIHRVTTLAYDDMGRLVEASRPGGLTDHYGYDLLGQRISHWNSFLGSGSVERTDYDAQGRIVSQIAFGGDTTTTAYAWDGTLATSGMGTFGGWTETTTYANGRTSIAKSDLFGRETWKQDLGGHQFTSSYDLAGRATTRAGASETLTYTWLNSGLSGSVTSSAGTASSYGYDAAGNRTSEVTTKNSATIQNATASWDALGRMTAWAEAGNATSPAASIAYSYDAAGNIRRTQASYMPVAADGSTSYSVTQDYWNRFDAMNRQVLAKGTLSNGAIVRGDDGISIGYDAAGQRVSTQRKTNVSEKVWRHTASNGIQRYYHERDYDVFGGTWSYISWDYQGDRSETYRYNADGTLDQMDVAQAQLSYEDGSQLLTVGAIGAARLMTDHSYDAMGRLTRQIDYDVLGAAIYDRQVTVNGKGQVSFDTASTVSAGVTSRSDTTYTFGTGTDYALGAAVTASAVTFREGIDNDAPDTLTTTTFAWWDGAVTASTSYDGDTSTSSNTVFTSSYTYDASGRLGAIAIADGRPRTITITNDLNGQAIRRDEADTNYSAGDPHEIWYRFGGRQLGFTGNNGTLETDYQASAESRTKTPGSGAFRGGASTITGYADFAQGYAPVTSTSDGSAGGYTVRGGETLSSIAANLWGDAALWYKLAEANGMSSATALAEGQTLIVPAGVNTNRYNASTFRPYDASDAVGDASPTTPKMPKKNKCGMMGQVMMVAVSLAVTALLPHASVFFAKALAGRVLGALLASTASQALGVATGVQEKFDWKAVAMAGVTAGVAGGLDKLHAFKQVGIYGSGMGVQAAQGSITNALTQGIGVATHLQSKFDFAGVAAAGVGQAAASRAGAWVGARGGSDLSATIYGGMADDIAGAASRSLLTGTSFGDNLIAVLPSVIGRTIGAAFTSAVAGERDYDFGAKSKDDVSPALAEDCTQGQRVQFAQLETNIASDGVSGQSSSPTYSTLSPANATALGQAGFGPGRIAAIDARLAAQAAENATSPSASLAASRRRALLQLIAPSSDAFETLTDLPTSVQNAFLDTDPEVISVRIQIQNARISADRTTMRGLSLNRRHYEFAVHLGIWRYLRGSNDTEAAVSNQAGVDNAIHTLHGAHQVSTNDVEATPDVRRFAHGIAELTDSAELSGSTQYWEKVAIIGRTDHGELVITDIRAGGSQGSRIADLITARSVAAFHIHYAGAPPGEQPLVTVPSGTDESLIYLRNRPSFMYSGATSTLYEVYRRNNHYRFGRVTADGNLTQKQPYVSSPGQ